MEVKFYNLFRVILASMACNVIALPPQLCLRQINGEFYPVLGVRVDPCSVTQLVMGCTDQRNKVLNMLLRAHYGSTEFRYTILQDAQIEVKEDRIIVPCYKWKLGFQYPGSGNSFVLTDCGVTVKLGEEGMSGLEEGIYAASELLQKLGTGLAGNQLIALRLYDHELASELNIGLAQCARFYNTAFGLFAHILIVGQATPFYNMLHRYDEHTCSLATYCAGVDIMPCRELICETKTNAVSRCEKCAGKKYQSYAEIITESQLCQPAYARLHRLKVGFKTFEFPHYLPLGMNHVVYDSVELLLICYATLGCLESNNCQLFGSIYSNLNLKAALVAVKTMEAKGILEEYLAPRFLSTLDFINSPEFMRALEATIEII